jgi:hypothetical protein
LGRGSAGASEGERGLAFGPPRSGLVLCPRRRTR